MISAVTMTLEYQYTRLSIHAYCSVSHFHLPRVALEIVIPYTTYFHVSARATGRWGLEWHWCNKSRMHGKDTYPPFWHVQCTTYVRAGGLRELSRAPVSILGPACLATYLPRSTYICDEEMHANTMYQLKRGSTSNYLSIKGGRAP